MFRHSTRRGILAIAAASLIIVLAVSLGAQDAWRPIQLSDRGEPIHTLKAIGIKAKAKWKEQSFDSFVFFWGRQGSGRYDIGAVINGLEGFLPTAELDEYRGPDLSEKAISKDCVRINIRRNKILKSFSTRLIMGATAMLPNDICGDSNEYFKTNLRLDEQETIKWKELLADLSHGIDEGAIIIGEGSFSKEITINFGGKGVSPLAKELAEFLAMR